MNRLLAFPTFLVSSAALSYGVVIDISGSSNEFADYSSLSNNQVFGDSTVTSGSLSLAVLNDSPIAYPENGGSSAVESPGLTWNTSYSAGSYSAGSEVNFNQGIVENSAADAISNDKFLTLSLSSSDGPVDWNSISVTLWRNGSGAAANYQFAYSADANWTTDDLLGSATAVGLGNNSSQTTIVHDASTIASGITYGEVRLYFWGGTNMRGNTHLTNVTADISNIPEPSAALIVGLVGVAGVLHIIRRRKRN